MSIVKSRTVRSSVALAFALSAMLVWSHERPVKTSQNTQVAIGNANIPCFFLNGQWHGDC